MLFDARGQTLFRKKCNFLRKFLMTFFLSHLPQNFRLHIYSLGSCEKNPISCGEKSEDLRFRNFHQNGCLRLDTLGRRTLRTPLYKPIDFADYNCWILLIAFLEIQAYFTFRPRPTKLYYYVQLKPDRSEWIWYRLEPSIPTSLAEWKRLQGSFRGNCLRSSCLSHGRTTAVPHSSLQTPPSAQPIVSMERKHRWLLMHLLADSWQ